MSRMCMWGINMEDDEEVTDTADSFIHMRLFIVVNIQMMTYYVVVYLPTYTLSTHYRLLLIFEHGHLWGNSSGGVICLLSGVSHPTDVYEIS